MFRRVLGLAAVFAFVFAVLVTAAPSLAQQSDTGTITVIVRTLEGKPVSDAAVFLIGGDSPQSSLTNAGGIQIFSNLAPGAYRIGVQHDGYHPIDLSSIEVRANQNVVATVVLTPSLKTIAAITARSSVTITNGDVSDDSAVRKISSTLSDALNKIAGVSVDDSAYGANSAFNISLRNHDSSQTGLSLNGSRLSGSGAAQLLAATQDLFTGASVDFSPTATSQGGTVNFSTLQPTRIWTYSATGTMSSYDGSSSAIALTGTAGKVGIAMQHATSGQDSPLDGMYFADSTGGSYLHEGGYARIGDLARFSAILSPAANAQFTFMRGAVSTGLICNMFTANEPCGYGLSASNRTSSNYYNFRFEALDRNIAYQVFATHSASSSDMQMPNRAVDGDISPYSLSGAYPFTNFGVVAKVTHKRHDLSIGLYGVTSNGYGTIQDSNGLSPWHQTATRSTDWYVYDHVKANPKLALTHGIDFASGTDVGSSLVLTEAATWQPSAADAFSASLSVGSANPPFGPSVPLGDPFSAQYDCTNESVTVKGPTSAPVRQWSANSELNWRHRFKDGYVSAALFSQSMTGQTAAMSIPLAADAQLVPGGLAGYLNSIDSVWSNPAVCGGMPFDPERVYVSQLVTNNSQVNKGLTANARLSLGRSVAMFANLSSIRSYFTYLPGAFTGAGSFYRVGMQIPGRPLHTGGLTLDGVWHHGAEWLLNAQYVDKYNALNQPAYVTLNAGVIAPLERGSLTFLVSNIFDERAGLFVTNSGYNPLLVAGGGSYSFATVPVQPRQISVQYRVHWSARAPRPARAK